MTRSARSTAIVLLHGVCRAATDNIHCRNDWQEFTCRGRAGGLQRVEEAFIVPVIACAEMPAAPGRQFARAERNAAAQGKAGPKLGKLGDQHGTPLCGRRATPVGKSSARLRMDSGRRAFEKSREKGAGLSGS